MMFCIIIYVLLAVAFKNKQKSIRKDNIALFKSLLKDILVFKTFKEFFTVNERLFQLKYFFIRGKMLCFTKKHFKMLRPWVNKFFVLGPEMNLTKNLIYKTVPRTVVFQAQVLTEDKYAATTKILVK